MLSVLDTEGVDIGPVVQTTAERYGLPLALVLGMLIAESGLNPQAERCGVWPDVSFGLGQMTVATAQGYGIGDGSAAEENKELVRQTLLDRLTNVDVCTRHLAGCWAAVEGYEERAIMALRLYNGGGWGLSEEYAAKYPDNIATYRYGLARAREILAEQEG